MVKSHSSQIDYALFASIALAVVSLFPIRTLLKSGPNLLTTF